MPDNPNQVEPISDEEREKIRVEVAEKYMAAKGSTILYDHGGEVLDFFLAAIDYSGLIARLDKAEAEIARRERTQHQAISEATATLRAHLEAAERALTLYREYVALLTESERALAVIAEVHGWHADPSKVERGAELRDEIRAALAHLDSLTAEEPKNG